MDAPRPTFREILEAVAVEAGVEPAALGGRGVARRFSRPRQRAVLIARRLRPDLSITFLAARLGGRDPSTITHAHQVAAGRLSDPAERAAVEAVLERLGATELPPAPPLPARWAHLEAH